MTLKFCAEFNRNKTQYDWFPEKSQNSNKLKKGREICKHFLKIKAKNSQKGRNLVKNGQILNILEFSRHAEYYFFKEQYEKYKLGRFIAAFGSYRSKTLKTVNFGQKWPNFGLKWPKIRHIRIFPAYKV